MFRSMAVLVATLVISAPLIAATTAEARPRHHHHRPGHRVHHHHHHRGHSRHWAEINRPHGGGMPITNGTSEVRINAVGEVIGPEPGK